MRTSEVSAARLLGFSDLAKAKEILFWEIR